MAIAFENDHVVSCNQANVILYYVVVFFPRSKLQYWRHFYPIRHYTEESTLTSTFTHVYSEQNKWQMVRVLRVM